MAHETKKYPLPMIILHCIIAIAGIGIVKSFQKRKEEISMAQCGYPAIVDIYGRQSIKKTLHEIRWNSCNYFQKKSKSGYYHILRRSIFGGWGVDIFAKEADEAFLLFDCLLSIFIFF